MRRSDVLQASPPLFDSPLLDRLTPVHPAVAVLLFAPVIAWLLVLAISRNGAGTTLAVAALGYVFWTLTEYWLHRVVFHYEPEDGWGARLHWMIHGVHHDHPNDPLRLVMPPSASIPLALLILGAIWLAAGSMHAPAVAAGFFAGYLIYDEMHYALHHHTPKSRLGKWLR